MRVWVKFLGTFIIALSPFIGVALLQHFYGIPKWWTDVLQMSTVVVCLWYEGSIKRLIKYSFLEFLALVGFAYLVSPLAIWAMLLKLGDKEDKESA
jgi:uncharacterized membrane protein YkvI